MSVSGYVHSVYSGGMVDGPGIRYVVFLSGCYLRCKYCHNPDTWAFGGNKMTVDEIVSDVKKYKSFIKTSGGGVTVTGGEPMAQPEFLAALLSACRAEGIHTALDTSGYASRRVAETVLPHTNLILLDIKSINPYTYKELTGVDIDRTLDMLALAANMKIPVWVRYVLLPGFTDDLHSIQALATYLRDFDNIEKVEVLPFHKAGEYKWEEVGTPYELKDVQPPPKWAVDRAQAVLNEALYKR